MLGALTVDRTLMRDTERARLAPADPMSAHLDLQPAIAACGAAAAGSLLLLVQTDSAVDCYRSDLRRIDRRAQSISGCVGLHSPLGLVRLHGLSAAVARDDPLDPPFNLMVPLHAMPSLDCFQAPFQAARIETRPQAREHHLAV
jgi:hypothetical protein